jgi:hypothetical protein
MHAALRNRIHVFSGENEAKLGIKKKKEKVENQKRKTWGEKISVRLYF